MLKFALSLPTNLSAHGLNQFGKKAFFNGFLSYASYALRKESPSQHSFQYAPAGYEPFPDMRLPRMHRSPDHGEPSMISRTELSGH